MPEAPKLADGGGPGTEMIIWGGVGGSGAYPVVGGKLLVLPLILGRNEC
jgi:hypothetical protein